jgi:hypothetical protein
MKSIALSAYSILAALLVSCSGSSSEPVTPEASASPTGEATAAPAASAAPTAEASAAPTAAPAATASAVASAAPEAPKPQRTPPTLTGTLAGKPFTAVAACVVGKAEDQKRVYLEIYDVKDFDVTKKCGVLPKVEGARKVGLVMSFSAGDKLDVTTLKSDKSGPEGYVMDARAGDKFDRKDFGKEIKPKGTVEVLRGAEKKGEVARLKVSLTAGKDRLEGEVDVDLLSDLAQ